MKRRRVCAGEYLARYARRRQGASPVLPPSGFTTTPTTTTAASKVILRLSCRRPGFHHGC